MGLDMYLSARKYVEKIDWNAMRENDIDYVTATFPNWTKVVDAADMGHIADAKDIYGVSVSVNAGYWRKANQIHKWFVDNVQNGEDDCGEYYVSHEKLKMLLELAKTSHARKDPSYLPPQEGFFFGGTDIDEWYWQDIKNTITQLEKIVNLPDFERLSFYYQSSW
jgi:hypothetical protein